MANDYTNDPSCKAHWGFEGEDWLVDDVNGLPLTNVDGTQNTETFIEGAAGATISTNPLHIDDADLPDGFPFKSTGTAVRTGAFTIFNNGTIGRLIGKYVDGSKGSFNLYCWNNEVYLRWYYSGDNYEQWYVGYPNPWTGWQHFSLYIDGPNKQATVIFNGKNIYTHTFANELQIDDSPLVFGYNNTIDGVAVFDRKLTTLDIFRIAVAKSYTGPRGTNDFSLDVHCKALYCFEPAGYLEDSKGNNDLTAFGAPNSTAYTAEGIGCIKSFDSTFVYCDDANLEAGFPFKYGANKIFTISGFVVPIGSGASYGGKVFAKRIPYETNTGFSLYLNTAPDTLKISYGNGASTETFDTGITLTAWRFYHISLAIDGAAPTLYIRVTDYYANEVYTYSAVPSAALALNQDRFSIGGCSDAAYNGYYALDEVVVFDEICSTEKMDAIRDGTYSPATSPDKLVSATQCEAIPSDVAKLSSLTACEAIALSRPDDCRSLTISQGLLEALPNACVSKTTCGPIIFDGGDFFLAL